jgi:undecaprenyl-diphosphatase
MGTRSGSHPLESGRLRARLGRVIDRARGLQTQLPLWLERLPVRRPQNWRAVLPLVLAAGVALAAGLAFLELGESIREGEFNEFDDAVLLWVAERRNPLLNTFFVAITALGSWPVIVLFTIGICVGALLAGKRRLPTTLALAMLGALLLSTGFKGIYGRERPRVVPHLETVATASFPSGHTIASVVLFVTLALFAIGHARQRRLRVFVVVYSLAIGALVAASRVYLGVHFPSDVMGGALIGIAWALTAVMLDRLLHGRRVRPGSRSR